LEDNWAAEFKRKLDADGDRAVAMAADDRGWFDANPERRFLLREATPHERYVGTAYELVLVANITTGVRWHTPVFFEDLKDIDPSAIGDSDLQVLFDASLELIEKTELAKQVRALCDKFWGVRHG